VIIDGIGQHRSTKRTIFLVVSAVAVVTVLIAARAVLLPFILALVVAYVLTPAVRRVEGRRLPRWAAILLVYAVVLGAIGGFISLIVPRLVAEGQALTTEWPRLKGRIRDEWLPAVDAKMSTWTGRRLEVEPAPSLAASPAPRPAPIHITPLPDGGYDVRVSEGVQIAEVRDGVWAIKPDEPSRALSSANMLQEGFDKAVVYLRENTVTVLRIGQQIVGAITYGVFTLFMTLMLAAYMILTHEAILGFFRELWHPTARDSFDRFLVRLDRGLSGVVRGQLLIFLVNGVLSAIGFWLFGLKYWPILSVIAAVMSLIPIFGSILSSIPAVLIGLTQSFGTALGVLAWIIGIHQVEANFLNPKIIGDSAKIHPVLVVFSLLVGEHFFQITGALFAVPCLSIAQTVFLHFRESTLGLPDPTASSAPPSQRLSILPLSPVRVDDAQPVPKTVRAPNVGSSSSGPSSEITQPSLKLAKEADLQIPNLELDTPKDPDET
jgi:predicted PurR-regulated permease PerM